MLHFFPRFGRDITQTPFATELRRLAVPHRLFAEDLNRQYETLFGLILRVYPMLFFCAARAAIRSMVLSRPKPAAVIITSDIEAIVFGLIRAVFSRRTCIVFETFIATEREKPWIRRLHHLHYSLVVLFVDVAICHSEIEAHANTLKFRNCRTVFVALPYALSVDQRDALRAQYGEASAASTLIVTAGRSGRDYATLARAIKGLPCQLRIICDWDRPTRDLDSDQITIVRKCFRSDYLAELAQARMVVIPLSQRNVSAGQMVLLQAFALAKPVIITETPTTREYVVDGVDAVFTAFADVSDMRAQIKTLLADPERCARLGANASARYDERFSTEAYVRRLVSLLGDVTGPRQSVTGRNKQLSRA